MKENNVPTYYTFTKVFSIIWFGLAIFATALMFKYIASGNIDARNLLYKIFTVSMLVITGLGFRELSQVLKNIKERDTFDFGHLNRIASYIKIMMLFVVVFGTLTSDNGFGPEMILLLACFAFVLIIFNLFPIYREMK